MLVSDGISEYTAQDDLVSALHENADTIDSASPTKHLPFVRQKKLEQLSKEIELLKQETRHMQISFRLLTIWNKALSPLSNFKRK